MEKKGVQVYTLLLYKLKNKYTLSVLKCKSFWHFTRFIEHSLNLDKMYVDSLNIFMNLNTVKYSQNDLYFGTDGVIDK